MGGGLGKTHIKKCFLVVGPLRIYPLFTNGLVVHATFFFFFFFLVLHQSETDFDNFFFFFPISWLKQPDFRESFLRSGHGGFTIPTPLMARPLKKNFLCVSSLIAACLFLISKFTQFSFIHSPKEVSHCVQETNIFEKIYYFKLRINQKLIQVT